MTAVPEDSPELLVINDTLVNNPAHLIAEWANMERPNRIMTDFSKKLSNNERKKETLIMQLTPIISSQAGSVDRLHETNCNDFLKTLLTLLAAAPNAAFAIRFLVHILMKHGFEAIAKLLDPHYVPYIRWQQRTAGFSESKGSIVKARLADLDRQYPLPTIVQWPNVDDPSWPSADDDWSTYYMQQTLLPVRYRMSAGYVYDTRGSPGMDSSRKIRGLCLISNVENYDEDKWKRIGSHYDVAAIEKLFRDKFLMDIHKAIDLSADDFRTELSKLEQLQPTEHNCLVAFLMCHGDHQWLAMRDASLADKTGYLKTEEVVNRLSSLKAFDGKPKLIFIAACRGINNSDSASEVVDLSVLKKQMKDTFIIFTTSKYFNSVRHKKWGSVGVRAFVEALRCRAHYKSIDSLMVDVNTLMEQYFKKSAMSNDREEREQRYEVNKVGQTKKFYLYCPKSACLHKELNNSN